MEEIEGTALVSYKTTFLTEVRYIKVVYKKRTIRRKKCLWVVMPPKSNDLQYAVGPTLDDFEMTALYNVQFKK